jgi:hypothetical protein
MLFVSRKNIDLAAFSFKCGKTSGRTNLNDIDLRKTRKGYSFAIRAHGSVTYADNEPDENAAVDISGRFTRTGKRPAGHLRVKSPRCGDTGRLHWSAKRDR